MNLFYKLFGRFIESPINSDYIMDLAEEWADDYVAKFVTERNNFDYNEVLMFCVWVLLIHTRGYHYSTGKTVTKTIDLLCTKCNQHRIVPLPTDQFRDLMLMRKTIYNKEVWGMIKCDYPRTKMYIPWNLIDFFTKQPINDNDIELALKYTENIGDFWNRINKDIVEYFPM